MSAAVEFKDVTIIFGEKKEDRRAALAMIDEGATREQILEKTGVVLGCASVGDPPGGPPSGSRRSR